MPPRYIDGLLLKSWRTRTQRSREEGARDHGITVEQLEARESGDEPAPRAILLAAAALEHRLEPLNANVDGARERCVSLVDDARAFAAGKPVISRLLRNPDRSLGWSLEFGQVVKLGSP